MTTTGTLVGDAAVAARDLVAGDKKKPKRPPFAVGDKKAMRAFWWALGVTLFLLAAAIAFGVFGFAPYKYQVADGQLDPAAMAGISYPRQGDYYYASIMPVAADPLRIALAAVASVCAFGFAVGATVSIFCFVAAAKTPPTADKYAASAEYRRKRGKKPVRG